MDSGSKLVRQQDPSTLTHTSAYCKKTPAELRIVRGKILLEIFNPATTCNAAFDIGAAALNGFHHLIYSATHRIILI